MLNYNTVRFEAAYGTSSQLPKPVKPEISFAGRSNVGKSSLLNAIFRRKNLVKVSSTPGKTSTVNFFSVDGVHFVDLPGYGFAKVSKSEKGRWSELIDGYFTQERSFSLVCSLIDIRHEASRLDEMMVSFLKEAQLPFAIVATKADKLGRMQQQKSIAALRRQLDLGDSVQMVACSSLTGAGIDQLRRVIESAL